ncbi:AMP-binding protein [Kibdelosporangium aridum]|uniref:AMP-binding protein n=1 Tax=Kibdelosporangium aridum TaxID=2030 RepID=UPI00052431DD
MLTYAGTHAWAMRLADSLIASGIRPGDHVGLIVANHLEFVPLKFAIATAGAIAVPFLITCTARTSSPTSSPSRAVQC